MFLITAVTASPEGRKTRTRQLTEEEKKEMREKEKREEERGELTVVRTSCLGKRLSHSLVRSLVHLVKHTHDVVSFVRSSHPPPARLVLQPKPGVELALDPSASRPVGHQCGQSSTVLTAQTHGVSRQTHCTNTQNSACTRTERAHVYLLQKLSASFHVLGLGWYQYSLLHCPGAEPNQNRTRTSSSFSSITCRDREPTEAGQMEKWKRHDHLSSCLLLFLQVLFKKYKYQKCNFTHLTQFLHKHLLQTETLRPCPNEDKTSCINVDLSVSKPAWSRCNACT
ncbi:hypothetical protein WMY93_012595 [Mugilogobius chulae]|uniref:Uncharacterized protein n=1 Tax=Mugilogobius chulae TaxID=88201 RepID=A0AAW0P918_9GOBI